MMDNLAKIIQTFKQSRQHRLFLQKQEIRAQLNAYPTLQEIDRCLNQAGVKLVHDQIFHFEEAQATYEKEVAKLKQERSAFIQKEGLDPQTFEVKYLCPKCKDTGYVEGEMCGCLKDQIARSTFEAFDFSPNAQDQTFENFDMQLFSTELSPRFPISAQQNMMHIKTHMETWCNEFEARQSSWLFYGLPGLGKTFLSNCIANALIAKGHTVVYVSTAHLINRMRDQIANHQGGLKEVLTVLLACDLLIIDDLGAEHITSFSNKQLFEIINGRLLKNKPMIISSNLSLKQIKIQYDERLSSRIAGHFTGIPFVGNDLRGVVKKRQQQTKN